MWQLRGQWPHIRLSLCLGLWEPFCKFTPCLSGLRGLFSNRTLGTTTLSHKITILVFSSGNRGSCIMFIDYQFISVYIICFMQIGVTLCFPLHKPRDLTQVHIVGQHPHDMSVAVSGPLIGQCVSMLTSNSLSALCQCRYLRSFLASFTQTRVSTLKCTGPDKT